MSSPATAVRTTGIAPNVPRAHAAKWRRYINVSRRLYLKRNLRTSGLGQVPFRGRTLRGATDLLRRVTVERQLSTKSIGLQTNCHQATTRNQQLTGEL